MFQAKDVVSADGLAGSLARWGSYFGAVAMVGGRT